MSARRGDAGQPPVTLRMHIFRASQRGEGGMEVQRWRYTRRVKICINIYICIWYIYRRPKTLCLAVVCQNTLLDVWVFSYGRTYQLDCVGLEHDPEGFSERLSLFRSPLQQRRFLRSSSSHPFIICFLQRRVRRASCRRRATL